MSFSLFKGSNSHAALVGGILGAGAYAATYNLSPALIGIANFTAASFFATYLGAINGALIGTASIAIAAIVIGALVSLALYAAYKWCTSSPTAAIENEENNQLGNQL